MISVANIDKTVVGIANLGTPTGSIMAGAALCQVGSNKISQFKNGNANVKAEIAGAAFGEILMIFGGEAAEAGKAGEFAKLAELG